MGCGQSSDPSKDENPKHHSNANNNGQNTTQPDETTPDAATDKDDVHSASTKYTARSALPREQTLTRIKKKQREPDTQSGRKREQVDDGRSQASSYQTVDMSETDSNASIDQLYAQLGRKNRRRSAGHPATEATIEEWESKVQMAILAAEVKAAEDDQKDSADDEQDAPTLTASSISDEAVKIDDEGESIKKVFNPDPSSPVEILTGDAAREYRRDRRIHAFFKLVSDDTEEHSACRPVDPLCACTCSCRTNKSTSITSTHSSRSDTSDVSSVRSKLVCDTHLCKTALQSLNA